MKTGSFLYTILWDCTVSLPLSVCDPSAIGGRIKRDDKPGFTARPVDGPPVLLGLWKVNRNASLLGERLKVLCLRNSMALAEVAVLNLTFFICTMEVMPPLRDCKNERGPCDCLKLKRTTRIRSCNFQHHFACESER